MQIYPIHPYAEAFPPLNEQDWNELLESVRKHGVLVPIVITPDGVLIDGVHRQKAAIETGQVAPARYCAPDADVIKEVISYNLARRHMNTSQRAVVADKLSALSTPGGDRKGDHSANSQNDLTQDKAAQIMSVGTRAVSEARKVREHGSPELYQKVKTGEVAVSAARQIVDLPHDDQKEILEEAQKHNFKGREGKLSTAQRQVKRRKAIEAAEAVTVPADARWELHHKTVSRLHEDVKGESVDIIFTDPPYGQEYIPVYEELAQFAQHALKPGGHLLVMTGQAYLPDIVDRMKVAQRIKWHWMMAYRMPGSNAFIHARNVYNQQKPILWYVKDRSTLDCGIHDMPTAKEPDATNEYHDWGQSEEGATSVLARFAERVCPGGVVCDPFVGGGAFGVAAVKLGFQFIGADKSSGEIQVTRARLSEVS